MAKEARIPPHIKRLICEAALKVPRKRRDAIATELQAAIEARRERVPAYETLLKMISEYRSKGQTELDTPWSLGSLANHYLPTDDLSDVVEVWKRCLAIETPFTIREARWVTWLRSTIPDLEESGWDRESRLGVLYAWASQYALRERATEALGIDNDTWDLDAELVSMGAWEWHTALSVGALAPRFARREENRRISDREDAIERDSAHYSPVIGGWPHEAVERELGGLDGWITAESERATSQGSWKFEPIASPEESRVYAYWLRHLSKGPNWDGIPFEHRKQIAVRLRQDVQAVEAATRQYCEIVPRYWGERMKHWGNVQEVYPAAGYSIGPEPGPLPTIPLPPEPYRQPMPPFFAWKPKDLLKEVGYED